MSSAALGLGRREVPAVSLFGLGREKSDPPDPDGVGDMLSLEGRAAVVTGGARGIGRAIAMRLCQAGASVLVTDVNLLGAVETAEEIERETGGRAVGYRLDVTDQTDVLGCGIQAEKQFGRLDIWVNNAGIFPWQDPVGVDRGDFSRVLDVNLTGTQLGIRAAAERMRESGSGGVIVNLASTAAYHGSGAYAASKWSIRGLTKGLAPVLGPQGIRIVAVAPTLIETPGIREIRESGDPAQVERLEELADSLPLGRVGRPDDVARAVLFLASDAASLITGVTLPVDAGELSL